MRRREFIAGLGGTAAWPVMARAQNAVGARRVGVLTGIRGDDPDAQLRYAAFLEGLRKLGWTNGQNVQVEARWGAGDAKLMRQISIRKSLPSTHPSWFNPSRSPSTTAYQGSPCR
jgi:putative tryptophan/tyrosine transport system substrate-binding protein